MSDEAPEVVTVTAVSVEPNECPLAAPLAINMSYTLAKPLVNAVWEVVYEADYTNKRKAVALHTTEPVAALAAGGHAFAYACPEIKTEGIKEKYLMQVGLLRLTLHAQGEANIVSVNMMIMVSKDSTGQLIRNVISPLD
jgi:hypothetical protein